MNRVFTSRTTHARGGGGNDSLSLDTAGPFDIYLGKGKYQPHPTPYTKVDCR